MASQRKHNEGKEIETEGIERLTRLSIPSVCSHETLNGGFLFITGLTDLFYGIRHPQAWIDGADAVAGCELEAELGHTVLGYLFRFGNDSFTIM